MDRIKTVKSVMRGEATKDGAGVRLKRIFGYHQVPDFDPFLLMDEFKSENPDDYTAGFPWHPHRGIETVTYLIKGSIKHGDSLGNTGVISEGECQWMTAGSGIIHTEMPQESELMWGYQLWVNLPAAEKMTAPRYRDIKSQDIPTVFEGDKGTVKVICGSYCGIKGPVQGITVEPLFLDVELKGNVDFEFELNQQHNTYVLVIEGRAGFDLESTDWMEGSCMVLFDEGNKLFVKSGFEGARLLLLSGKPLKEPVAWGGPIVMNTREELHTAFREYESGEFIKVGQRL